MFEYFAGKYLVYGGLAGKEKLDEIFARLKIVNANLKEMRPEDHNLLEHNQVAFIQLLQNSIDEKLGDLASEYGTSDETKKSFVRKQQVLNTVFFNQLIVEGVLVPEQLVGVLEKIRTYYGLNAPGISRNFKDDFDSILSDFVRTDDYFAKEYAMIALKHILRFVATRIRFDASSKVFGFSSERVALQKVVCANSRYFIGICGEKPTLQKFNDGITHAFASSRSDTRYGSLCALLNCVSNIFQCFIAREHEVINVGQADVYKYSTIFSNENCFAVPLTVEDMKLTIVVGYGVKPNFATISHNV